MSRLRKITTQSNRGLDHIRFDSARRRDAAVIVAARVEGCTVGGQAVRIRITSVDVADQKLIDTMLGC
jgi:hypothetical protein